MKQNLGRSELQHFQKSKYHFISKYQFERTSVTSRRPVVRTSGRLDVRASGCPEVRMFGRPYVQTSRRLDIRTSRRPDVWTSRRPDVRMSRRPDVQTSGCPDVLTSGRLDVRTSRPIIFCSHHFTAIITYVRNGASQYIPHKVHTSFLNLDLDLRTSVHFCFSFALAI